MKKYTIKNYKGNLVESLKNFSKKYKGMKIVEAVEDPDEKALKVTAESSDDDNLYVAFNEFVDNLHAALCAISDFEFQDVGDRFIVVLQNILDAIEKEYSSDDHYYKPFYDVLHTSLKKLKDVSQNRTQKPQLKESADVTAWCSIVMDNVDEDDVVDILTDAELKYNVKIVRKYKWEKGFDGNKGFVDDVIEVHAPDMETFRKFVSEWVFAGQAQQDEIDDYIKDSLSKDTAGSNNSQNIDLQSYDL